MKNLEKPGHRRSSSYTSENFKNCDVKWHNLRPFSLIYSGQFRKLWEQPEARERALYITLQ